MFEFDFLSELTLLDPKKDASGDVLFATYYHLGDLYNVYSMANDLPELMNYNDAVKYIGDLNKKPDKNWFIPHKDLLMKIYEIRNHGDFAGTFTTTPHNRIDGAHWYWSSTEYRVVSDYVWCVDFSDGVIGWFHKGFTRLSCRPCRVELIT